MADQFTQDQVKALGAWFAKAMLENHQWARWLDHTLVSLSKAKRNEKGAWKLTLQNQVADLVNQGKIEIELAKLLLASRDAYGPKGRKALELPTEG